MEVTAEMLLTVLPLVFLAAAVDAIAGGGGLISLPAYLLAGLPPVLASGTNKFSALFASLSAALKYLRQGKVVIKAALPAAMGALPGAYLGAELLKRVNDEWLRGFMLAAIPLAAVMMLWQRKDSRRPPKPPTGKTTAACLLIGLGVGVYDGFFGPGTGTFLILLFTWFAGMDLMNACGTAKVVNLASNAAAVVSLASGGKVLYALAVPAAICALTGGYVGARLALKRGAKLIRYAMLAVLALLLAKLACDFFA